MSKEEASMKKRKRQKLDLTDDEFIYWWNIGD